MAFECGQRIRVLRHKGSNLCPERQFFVGRDLGGCSGKASVRKAGTVGLLEVC